MTWLGRVLIGPALWALIFGLIYGLNGMQCAGFDIFDQPAGTARIVLVVVWAIGLLAFWPLFRNLPAQDSDQADLPRAGLWIGLAASVFTIFPVLLLTQC